MTRIDIIAPQPYIFVMYQIDRNLAHESAKRLIQVPGMFFDNFRTCLNSILYMKYYKTIEIKQSFRGIAAF